MDRNNRAREKTKKQLIPSFAEMKIHDALKKLRKIIYFHHD